jgi:hypothetical protein
VRQHLSAIDQAGGEIDAAELTLAVIAGLGQGAQEGEVIARGVGIDAHQTSCPFLERLDRRRA